MAENIKQLNIGNETYNLDAYNADYAAEAGNSDKLGGYSADAIVFREASAYAVGAPIQLNGLIRGVVDSSTGMDDEKIDQVFHSEAYLSRIGNNTVGYIDDIKDATMKNQVVHYVAGPATDTTAGTWTGTIPGVSAYYDGLSVLYVPAVKGASTTTLSINGLEAKTCYYNNTSKLTTQYAVGTPILLTYIGGYWKRADYNSNTDTKVTQTLTEANVEYPIILAYNADTESVTNAVNKAANFTFNPSDGGMKVPKIIIPIDGSTRDDGTTIQCNEIILKDLSTGYERSATLNNRELIINESNSMGLDSGTIVGGGDISFWKYEKSNITSKMSCDGLTIGNTKLSDYSGFEQYYEGKNSDNIITLYNGELSFRETDYDTINNEFKITASTVSGTDLAKHSWRDWLLSGYTIPTSSLPSYVDDVLEYSAKASFPTTGETGKIYVDTTTNKTYRWSGSAYVEISASLALGETSSTAYRGDRGKIAYDHSQSTHAPTNAEKNQNAFSNVKVGSTTVAADTTTDTIELVAGSNITLTPDATNDKITIAATNTTYSAGNGLTSSGTTFNVGAGTGISVAADSISAKLKSTTASTINSTNAPLVSSQLYSVIQDKSGYLSVSVPWTKTNVTVNQALTTGTNIGSITIDGTTTQLYAPMAGEAVTYDVFTGATESAAGTTGLVPGPSAGWPGRVLTASGQWMNYLAFESQNPRERDSIIYIGGSELDDNFHYIQMTGRDSAYYQKSEITPFKIILDSDRPQSILEKAKLSLGHYMDISSNVEEKGIVLDATNNIGSSPTITLTKYWQSGSGSTLMNNIDSQLTITSSGISFNDNRGSDDFTLTRTSVSGNETVLTSWKNWLGIKNMTGASSSAAGATGLVPAPIAGDQTKYLRGDGTWQSITTNTVQQNSNTSNANYPLLFKYTSGTSTTAETKQVYFNTGVTVNPSTQTITAYGLNASEIYADYFIAEDTNGTSYTLLDLDGLQITDTTNDIYLASSGGLEYYTGDTLNFKIDATGNPSGTDTIKSSWKTWLGIDAIENQLSTLVDANGVSY